MFKIIVSDLYILDKTDQHEFSISKLKNFVGKKSRQPQQDLPFVSAEFFPITYAVIEIIGKELIFVS